MLVVMVCHAELSLQGYDYSPDSAPHIDYHAWEIAKERLLQWTCQWHPEGFSGVWLLPRGCCLQSTGGKSLKSKHTTLRLLYSWMCGMQWSLLIFQKQIRVNVRLWWLYVCLHCWHKLGVSDFHIFCSLVTNWPRATAWQTKERLLVFDRK